MLERELKIALHAVSLAAQICRKVRLELSEADTFSKEDRSPVTVADLAGQAAIAGTIRAAFPEDAIVAEEEAGILNSSDVLRNRVMEAVRRILPGTEEDRVVSWIGRPESIDFSGRFWTLDPIDGTKGFLRGDQYAVALALIERGSPVLGILGCPNWNLGGEKGCLSWAIQGQGSWMRSLDGGKELRMKVSRTRKAEEAHFCESLETGHSDHDVHGRIADRLGISAEPKRMDSQAKYTAVACGEADFYIRLSRGETYREKIWDHAAGFLIVTEAGGRVTDFRGRPLDFSKGRQLQGTGVLASNKVLHDTVLAAIQAETQKNR